MSCNEKSVPVFTEPVELKWYTVLHHGLASGTHSETSASEPRGDSGYTLAEYLLVCLYDPQFNPGGLSGVGFMSVHHWLQNIVNAESRMSCALSNVDTPRSTLTAS